MLNSTILSFQKIHETLYILFGSAVLNQSPVPIIADILIFQEIISIWPHFKFGKENFDHPVTYWYKSLPIEIKIG